MSQSSIGFNSQDSDTFVSLERLPEAGQVSSQMDGESQQLSLEVDASSQGASSQLSSDLSEHSAEPPLEGNFPAVNIVAASATSPTRPQKDGEAVRPPAGPDSGPGSPRGIKSGGRDRNAPGRAARPGQGARAGAAAAAAAAATASPRAAAGSAATPPASESASQRAAPSAQASPSAATMEAEVDAADVLLSLSQMSARQLSKKHADNGMSRKRSKSENKEGAKAKAQGSAQSGALGAAAPGAAAARGKKQATAGNYAAAASGKSPQLVLSTKEAAKAPRDAARNQQTAAEESAARVHMPPASNTATSASPAQVHAAHGENAAHAAHAAYAAHAASPMAAAGKGSNSGEKRPAVDLADFVNPEALGYVHKFRWEEQPEPAKKKAKASSWVLPQKRADREKLQTGGVKAGQQPAKKKTSSSGGVSQKPWIKTPVPNVPVLDESNDADLAREELAVKLQYETEIGHDVQFAHLQIQTSNIKVSFSFDEVVTIDKLCEHLKKDEVLITDNYKVRIKDKSAASNQEGRTFFGGVLTITMDVWDVNFPEAEGHNTSVRLFGFREMDPERRHKAQFNGCSCKHGDTLPFFREVFGRHHKMADIRVEPNSVFSATDNAVMDPRYGLDMEALKLCLEKCQADDIVQNFNLQVTGGVNFSFTALKGEANERTCKPTVQKSGSIQLMLVDAPRRIRLETMRFLIQHCKSAFAPLVNLNLTKRTIDKRQKARRLVEQYRLRELAIQERRARAIAEKAAAAGQGGLKQESDLDVSAGGGVAGVAGGASAAAIYGAASGHTSAATTAPPCNEPGTDPRGAHEPRLRDAHALDVTLDSLKLMAAATVAARQPAAVQSVLSTLGLTLMPDLLADPLFNVSSAAGASPAPASGQGASAGDKAHGGGSPQAAASGVSASTAAIAASAAAMAAADKELESLL